MYKDELKKPERCDWCGAMNCFETDFRGWTKLKLINEGQSVTDRLDKNNAIQNARVTDDPLCLMELGLHQDAHNLKSISNEQAKYFREKLLRDKDSGALRKEILAARAKAVKDNADRDYTMDNVHE
jgi:hypothetical protein